MKLIKLYSGRISLPLISLFYYISLCLNAHPNTIILFIFPIYILLTEPTKENSFSEELFIIVFPWLLNTVAGTAGAQLIFAE